MMKHGKKLNVIKFLEAYNRFFTDQEKHDFINEEILFLTRDESEKRIIVGNMMYNISIA